MSFKNIDRTVSLASFREAYKTGDIPGMVASASAYGATILSKPAAFGWKFDIAIR